MKKTMWVLLDNRMGSVGQAKGIALALQNDLEIVYKQLIYTPFSALPNFMRGTSLLGVNTKTSDALTEPYPDLVLSISRRTLPVARYIRRKSQNRAKIIQLMYPGKTGLQDIELLILPEHDRKKNSPANFFYITGCPHRITAQTIKEAQDKWQKPFSELPKPWTAVVIGGSIKNKPFTLDNATDLAQQIKEYVAKNGGSILITTSRRTGAEAQNLIMENLKEIPAYTYLWGEKKDNPYMGFLACSDSIIVTGDTVSMCSEACGTGKPVYIFRGKNWLANKHLRFVESLLSGGYALALEHSLEQNFHPKQALNNTAQIAGKILEIR